MILDFSGGPGCKMISWIKAYRMAFTRQDRRSHSRSVQEHRYTWVPTWSLEYLTFTDNSLGVLHC